MSRPIVIRAEWDPEAQVWVATSPDVEGFVTEAASLEILRRKTPAILQDLAEGTDLRLDGVDIEYVAHARERFKPVE